jgi:CheY-like chemotaxis protein/HPt (histidine-containing phosphotransfer) domain-containing protein
VSHKARGQKTHFNARVLVAEDNLVNQDVATGILENMGCRVVTASNGAAAVRLMAQERFDLVLMDCEMPELDGFEATLRIRQHEGANTESENDGRLRRTPIVALTAHALADIRRKCLAAGMDDFLTKPFNETHMGEALHRWIGHLEYVPPASEPAEPAHSVPPAETHPASEASPIDRGVLDQVNAFKGAAGEALFRRVVSRFAGTAPGLAASMQEKFTAGDAEELWRVAHSLKSSASALGAHRLAGCAGKIEHMAREQGLEAVQPLLVDLNHELSAALRSLSNMTGESHEPVAQRA